MAYARPLFEVKLPGVGLGVWDATLIALAALLALRRTTWKGRIATLDLTLLSSLVALGLWTALGLLRGGDARQAQTQLNALARMFVIFFVCHATVRKSRDATRLASVILAAAIYRAVACVTFFWLFARAGRLNPYPEFMTDHDDSTLWAAAVLGLVSWALASRRCRVLIPGSLVGMLVLLAVLYNNRRLAWIEIGGGLGLLYVGMVPGRFRKAVSRYTLAFLPLLALYVMLGWSQTQRIFAPVQQLKSALTDTANPSNDARILENRGLIVTLQNARLFGTGFGQEFTEVSDIYALGMRKHFPNYRYLPHNSLLGLVAFTGAFGFSVIWTFVPVCAFLAARAHAHARSTADRALSLTAFAVPFVYSVQAYGDMGLYSLKANLILAASMAVAARLAVNTGGWATTVRSVRVSRMALSRGVLPQ
jgi:hypothetical protein